MRLIYGCVLYTRNYGNTKGTLKSIVHAKTAHSLPHSFLNHFNYNTCIYDTCFTDIKSNSDMKHALTILIKDFDNKYLRFNKYIYLAPIHKIVKLSKC